MKFTLIFRCSNAIKLQLKQKMKFFIPMHLMQMMHQSKQHQFNQIQKHSLKMDFTFSFEYINKCTLFNLQTKQCNLCLMNNKYESQMQDDLTQLKINFVKDKQKLMETNVLNDFNR